MKSNFATAKSSNAIRNGLYLIFFLLIFHFIKSLLTISGLFSIFRTMDLAYFSLMSAFVYLFFYFITKRINMIAGLFGAFFFYIMEAGVSLIYSAQKTPTHLILDVVIRLIVGFVLFKACKGATAFQQET